MYPFVQYIPSNKNETIWPQPKIFQQHDVIGETME